MALVRDAAPDGVLYGGGGILRSTLLAAAGGRVLNAHAGPLPEIRGMNACEWSLLLDHPLCVSIHVVDRGIDTGPVLLRRPVKREPGDDVPTLRSRCTAAGVDAMLEAVPALANPLPPPDPAAASHRQCFVLAPAMAELLERKLARRERGS